MILALALFHFFVPFFLLLVRNNKKRKKKYASENRWSHFDLQLPHSVDLYWLISPAFHHDGLHLHWLDVVAPVGIGGLWLATFYTQLKKRPLSPLPDPFADAEQAMAEHA